MMKVTMFMNEELYQALQKCADQEYRQARW